MKIKAVISDVYRTLIDIKTDEKDDSAYRTLAAYLKYQGIYLSSSELEWFFFEKKARQKERSSEECPEHDYRSIWGEILRENMYSYTGPDLDNSSIVSDIVKLHRSLTVRKIKLYPGVYETFNDLKNRYRLGIVSDSQPDHAGPELKASGIYDFFNTVIISGKYGYRKPDTRLFKKCLKKLDVEPDEAVFIGNDLDRDIRGAKNAGMKSVLILTKYDRKDRGIGDADYIIDRISDIYGVLEDLWRR